jgi:hypothetical protein
MTILRSSFMRSLQYFFYEVQPNGQRILHDFGTDRVSAFTTHRLLEVQGKTLSVVQIKRAGVPRPTGMGVKPLSIAQSEPINPTLQSI